MLRGLRTLGLALALLLGAAGGCSSPEDPANDTRPKAGGAGSSSGGKGSSGQSGTAGESGRAGTSGGAGSAAGGRAASGGAPAAGAAGSAAATSGSSGVAGLGGGTAARGGSGTGEAGEAGASGGSCTTPGIAVEGRRLLVDCEPFHLRGVCWNPVPRGETHPAGLDYAGAVAEDSTLMQAIGINVVRTYEPLTDRSVLDALYEKGIRVLSGVYVYGGDAASVVSGRVNAVKDHPAILAWVLGNEWNYNGLYVDLSHSESLARLNEAAALIRAEDTRHPIVTVYGELPSTETIEAMPLVDVWGLNAYRGISFGDLFDSWRTRSEKPMFLAEYGADAYDAIDAEYDPESQAMAVGALTAEIAAAASSYSDEGVSIGGTLFEWSDEWWKDQGGAPDEHDVGGIAPGGGPYPDQTFNEEWWGIVDVERATRPAYARLGEAFANLP
jgi:hypothetical protein